MQRLFESVGGKAQNAQTQCGKRESDYSFFSGANLATRYSTGVSSQPLDDTKLAKKNAEKIASTGLTMMEPPTGDVIEADEICVRWHGSLWLWVIISRKTRQVLSYALGSRDAATWKRAWQGVPMSYRALPVKTDGWKVYSRFFAGAGHEVCAKGSGKTSIVEALNTKWRQRQSALVRRSCGVSSRIQTDITDRFLILLESHNNECIQKWQVKQKTSTTN